jgi:hypothetical protein
MEPGKFGYPAQKLAEARRFLMAFYLKEVARFGNAAACCQSALREFDSAAVKDRAVRAKVETLKSLMEVPAGSMTYDQRVVFGTVVDEVADWFTKEHWLGKRPEPAKLAATPKKAAPRKTAAARPKAARGKPQKAGGRRKK